LDEHIAVDAWDGSSVVSRQAEEGREIVEELVYFDIESRISTCEIGRGQRVAIDDSASGFGEADALEEVGHVCGVRWEMFELQIMVQQVCVVDVAGHADMHVLWMAVIHAFAWSTVSCC
jgi:hypothetical protein